MGAFDSYGYELKLLTKYLRNVPKTLQKALHICAHMPNWMTIRLCFIDLLDLIWHGLQNNNYMFHMIAGMNWMTMKKKKKVQIRLRSRNRNREIQIRWDECTYIYIWLRMNWIKEMKPLIWWHYWEREMNAMDSPDGMKGGAGRGLNPDARRRRGECTPARDLERNGIGRTQTSAQLPELGLTHLLQRCNPQWC